MRSIHPRLEEIRKRLMEPHVPTVPPRYTAPKRVAEVYSPAPAISPEVPSGHFEAADAEADATESSPYSPAEGTPLVEAVVNEQHPAEVDDQTVPETPRPIDGLAQAIAELFEPARQCQSRLAEIRSGFDLMEHLTRLAVELCEPLKDFHDHIRRLSSSFESMCTFRDELGVLAQSFTPVRALHQQVTQLAQMVRTNLAEVAHELEPAKALQIDIANLAAAIDSVSELQVRFQELSRVFGDHTV